MVVLANNALGHNGIKCVYKEKGPHLRLLKKYFIYCLSFLRHFILVGKKGD